MKSQTYIVFICLYFLVCFDLAAVQADDDLSIKISTDKESYTIGKPIKLKMKITNTSNQSIKINTRRFSPKVRIAKMLHIQSPDGKTLVSMAQTGGGVKTKSPPTTTLSGGETLSKTVNLLELFPKEHPDRPHHFYATGTYSISAIYQNKLGDNSIWKGKTSSNKISVEVNPLSEEQLNELKKTIKQGNNSEKIDALELANKIELKLPVELIRPLLKGDQPESIRENAAEALDNQHVDSKLYDLYMKYVRDSNFRVSAYMAGFLGELGDKNAVPALIDAVKRENRYNYAALRALRDIGDPRAVPVFENFLENGANTQLKKRFAKEALEKIRSSTGEK